MELVNDLINNQLTLYIPIALVLVGAILVFAFGFKSPEQPPFDKLTVISNEERRNFTKKRKTKETKKTNGHVNQDDTKGDKNKDKGAKKSPVKENQETPKQKKEKKNEVKEIKVNEVKKPKLDEVKPKKSAKNKVPLTKPEDYDDEGWETIPKKNEKKKKQESPAKKEKPTKLVKSTDKEKNQDSDKENRIEEVIQIITQQELLNKEKIDETKAKKEKKVKKPKEIKVDKVTVETEIQAQHVTLPKPEKVVEVKNVEEIKEKKNKKPRENNDIKKPIIVEEQQKEIREIPTENVAQNEENQGQGTVAFDELGDTWTEAKMPKKSKKKARRDN